MKVEVSPEPLPLSHGGPLPRIGLGVYRIEDGEPVRRAVRWALEEGYRLVDTAAMYHNEAGVGRALRDAVAEGVVSRDEVFVTTKLWNDDHGYDRARAAFDESLERLGLDRVDLFLIHWPVEGLRRESWRALEEIHGEGRARAVGVSNYMVHHLEELLGHARLPPAVNQIELHPFNYRSRRPVLELCREHGIAVEAYSPLTKARRLDHPALEEMALRHGRTPAQILIRYVLEKGTAARVKSSRREGIRENVRVFDFELSEQDHARLDALDEGLAVSWDPTQAP